MKLARFFKLAVSAGIAADPRGKDHTASYSDSAILYGEGTREIRGILAGIDIDVQEVLLADRLRGAHRIDCILSHHPAGSAYARLFEVMELQVSLMAKAGVGKKSAAGFLAQRMKEVERKILPQNHARAVDAARLLDIPLVCIHTPADNCAALYVNRLLSGRKPATAGDIITALDAVEEYRDAAAQGTGPRLVAGHPGRATGKIFIEFTGGAEGPKEAYGVMKDSGVGTLVSMHIGEDNLKEIKRCGLNAVIAGHIASDTLGLNLILDKIEKEERLEISCCSGFRRHIHPYVRSH